MIFTLSMPKLSPTMEEGTIVSWDKSEGEYVKSGEVLLRIVTDKATVEYQAIDDGWLRKIFIGEKESALINQPIALFSEEKQEEIRAHLLQLEEKKGKDIAESEVKVVETPVEKFREEELSAPKQTLQSREPIFSPWPPLEESSALCELIEPLSGYTPLASPLAKKIAKKENLDLSSVKGSGIHGRIMSRDLERAEKNSAFSLPSQDFSVKEGVQCAGSYTEVALSPMRKVIGKRLQQSKSFIPHFYVTQSVDAQKLLEVRKELKECELSITINDFIIRACAIALKKHPEVNRGFHSGNQTIIQFDTVDIAIAVSVKEGLITPIIRHANYKNLKQISSEVKKLAEKAREGSLELHEYQGGSFTISNLGMFGIEEFQAILNPPQSAILAVGGVKDVAMVHGERIVPGKSIHLTLSADHRVIDGTHVALFLNQIKYLLEHPSSLLLSFSI